MTNIVSITPGSITGSSTSVTFNFLVNAPNNTEKVTVTIEKSDFSATPYSQDISLVGTAPNFTVSGTVTLPAGDYLVRAFPTDFSFFTARTAVSVGLAPPNSPTGVAINVLTDTSFQGTWGDASSNETGFKVQYRARANGSAALGSYANASGSPTAANATALTIVDASTSGQLVQVRVASSNSAGDSIWVESAETWMPNTGVGGGSVPEGSPPASTVTSVTISPTTASLAPGATQQFAATVQGANLPSQAVTWSAPAGGTANSSGVYTAPGTPSNAYKMRATSVQDSNVFAEATIAVNPVVSPTPLPDDNSPTAGDQIERALRLIGVLAEGETMSAPVARDSLVALNQMIDSWSIEKLTVFTTEQKVFTWPAGQISRTMGPTGNFVTTRPIQVDDSTYFKDTASGLSYGVVLLTDLQYNSIPLKTVTSSYPQLLYVNYGMPNVTLTAHPVPTKTLEWVIVSVLPLTQPSTLNTKLIFPPGYMRAFAYNLAMEIAPEFGVEPPTQVQKIAATSKRNIKRVNSNKDLLSLPSTMIAQSSRYNIYSGK